MFSTGNLRAAGLATSLALASLGLVACGSGGGDTTVVQPPPIAPDTAAHLAKLSDRVASDLDGGDTCHAAHAADDLNAAVEEANLPASMSSDVDEVTGRLVDEVNCPPPPLTEEEQKKLEEEQKKLEEEQRTQKEHHDEHPSPEPPGHAKHGGVEPPGHAKLEGE
jgi:hypothetical protein